MLIIPAIDLRKGRCVRLAQGDVRDETVYSREPVSIAKLWQLRGAKLLHIVDLDGAITGKPKNLDVVSQIAKAVRIPIQFGGGIRSLETIEEVFKKGVDKIILGTSAYNLIELVKEAYKNYKDKILVSIDAKNGYVAIKGWKDVTNKRAITLAKEIIEIGIKTIIFTDIKRDGMLCGPNFKSIKDIATAVDINIIAAGGISTLANVENINAMEKYGVTGMIIGKAIYTGAIDLKDAIKISASPVPANKKHRKRKYKENKIARDKSSRNKR